jgi:hypothetical protein
MKELDLHGLYRHEVRDAVENFILVNSKELPIRIIVGNSTFMRNLTKNILEQYKYQYEVPAHNPGEVVVVFDNEYKL